MTILELIGQILVQHKLQWPCMNDLFLDYLGSWGPKYSVLHYLVHEVVRGWQASIRTRCYSNPAKATPDHHSKISWSRTSTDIDRSLSSKWETQFFCACDSTGKPLLPTNRVKKYFLVSLAHFPLYNTLNHWPISWSLHQRVHFSSTRILHGQLSQSKSSQSVTWSMDQKYWSSGRICQWCKSHGSQPPPFTRISIIFTLRTRCIDKGE